MYLYAVQMNIFGYPFMPVKIGCTDDPDARVKVYSSGPFPTSWLGTWEVEDARTEERKIHRKFQDYRLAGEWFYPSKGLIAFIERKISIPIYATLSCPPSRQHTEFQQRFVRLFPDGIASIEREWDRPGKAKPCSDSALNTARERLDVIEQTNPLRNTPIWQ